MSSKRTTAETQEKFQNEWSQTRHENVHSDTTVLAEGTRTVVQQETLRILNTTLQTTMDRLSNETTTDNQDVPPQTKTANLPKAANLMEEASSCKGKSRALFKELMSTVTGQSGFVVPPNAGCPGQPVNLTVSLTFEEIEHLDMEAQTLSLRAWLEVKWQDESLAWDTARYPFRRVHLPASAVWKPSVAIHNTLLPSDQLVQSSMFLTVAADGLVRWLPGGSFLVTCKVDITLYPFDRQTCWLTLTQWSMFEEDANVTSSGVGHIITGNGEWEVTHTQVERVSVAVPEKGAVYWYLEFSLTIQRKWVFYALHVILPIALVSVLNSAVLALPVQCGERMSVTVTTFLTLAVFVTLVHDTLPKNSDTVCYLSVYLALQMCLGAVAVVVSTAVVTHHHCTEDRVHAGSGAENHMRNAAPGHSLNNIDHEFNDKTHNAKKKEEQKGCTVGKSIFLTFAALNGLSFVAFMVAVVG